MAERRMFAKTIIDSDAFLDMPLSSQALYFHLSMRADDDGFVNNPRKVMRMIGASDGDAQMLLQKRFILAFDSGVIVIKHWRIHNWIRGDRKHSTVYTEEMAQLEVKSDGGYTERKDDNQLTDICQTPDRQLTDNCHTEVSIGKDSIGKDSVNNIGEKSAKRFIPPTLEEAKAYCTERHNRVDPERFIDFYAAKDWMIGKNKMKDWKAAIRNWERSSSDNKTTSPIDYGNPEDFFS